MNATEELSIESPAGTAGLPETPDMEALLEHGRHVAVLAATLFEELAPLHKLDENWGRRLLIAARLHDIGMAEGRRKHHKASMRLIENDLSLDIPAGDRPLAALLARYHRKAWPSPRHGRFARLDQDAREAVRRAAALLRIADALDYTHSGAVADVSAALRKHSVLLACRCRPKGTDGTESEADCALELKQAGRKGDLFRHVFSLKLELTCLPR